MKPFETARAEFGFASEGASPAEKAVSSEIADRLSEISETPDAAAPPLPDRRTADDLPVDSSVLAWLPADRYGDHRELIPGRVDSVDPKGWMRVALEWSPGGCIVATDSATVIPLEALSHLHTDDAYLEAWTATDDDPVRRAWELRYALKPWLETEEIRVRTPGQTVTGSVGRRRKTEITAEEIIDRLGLGHLIAEAPESAIRTSPEPAIREPVEPPSRPSLQTVYEPTPEELRDDATLEEEMLAERCAVAWNGLHRRLADGSNPYLE